MASCSYSSLLRDKTTSCGSNWINTEAFQCVSLKDCNKDVSTHLKSCKVSDDSVTSEVQLLLARAGTVLGFITYALLFYQLWNATIICLFIYSNFVLLSIPLGVFIIEDFHTTLTVCPRHRETFGFGWRSGKVRCPIPSEIAGHKASTAKGDRGISSKESAFVLMSGHSFLPIGTRKNMKLFNTLAPELLVTETYFGLITHSFL